MSKDVEPIISYNTGPQHVAVNTNKTSTNPSTAADGKTSTHKSLRILGIVIVAIIIVTLCVTVPAVKLTRNVASTTRTTSKLTTTTSTRPRTSTTTRTATTSTISVTTIATTSTINVTDPASMICVSANSTALQNNQFIFSPSQLYAAGMMNNQFGIYLAYSNANVTSSTIWLASQSSTAETSYLEIQNDRNLVVYTVSRAVTWAINLWDDGSDKPYCLTMLNSGNLIWTNNNNTIIWQTNSTQTG